MGKGKLWIVVLVSTSIATIQHNIPTLRKSRNLSCSDSPFSFSFHKNINLTSTGICIYYDNVAKAFQNGDPEALANMFDDKITDPMSKDEIFAWAKGLFAQYGSATFEVEKLVLEH